MESRRMKYESGEPFREARYSSKHLFSTLIKCEHCGRSFTRKTYTYVNTRVYWRCVTNDQYTAEKCDNRVTLDEPQLKEELRRYLASLIEHKDAFAADILASLEKQIPEAQDPAQAEKEMERKRKKLLSKKSRYQEMYANDLISMAELKDKLAGVAEELKAVDLGLEQIARSAQLAGNTEQIIQHYRHQILAFLELKTVTNMDMRRMIDHISVNKNGSVRVVLKKFADMAIA